MQFNDLYFVFFLIFAIISAVGLLFYGFKDIRLAVSLVLLTPILSALFYKNEVIWITEELETGYSGYLRGAIIIFCLIVGVVIFLKKWPAHKGALSKGYYVLFTFIVFAIITLTYTLDEKYTAVRSFFFVGIFFLLIGLDKWLSSREKLHSLLNTMFYICVAVVLINLISMGFPSRSWWWRTPRFIGLFEQPNQTGAYMMLCYPLFLWKFYSSENELKQKILAVTILVIALLLHVLTGSRTTIIGSILGISVFLLIKRKIVKLVAVSSIASLFLIVLLFLYTPETMTRGDANSALTITGRDVLWKGAITRLLQNPLLGYGYMVESKILNLESMEGTFSLATAQQPLHNGYLSIITGTGLIGFSMWLVIIFFPMAKSAKIREPYLIDYKAYCFSTMIMVLVANFFESFLTGYIGNGGDVFFWFAWVIGIKISEQAIVDETENQIE